MEKISPMTGRLATCLALLLCTGFLPGCYRPEPITQPVISFDQHILWLVGDVDDRSSSPGELRLVKRVFAFGHEPSDKVLPRYAAFRYKGKNPVQNGDSATVTVIFADAKTGKPAGEAEWSASKLKGMETRRRSVAGRRASAVGLWPKATRLPRVPEGSGNLASG